MSSPRKLLRDSAAAHGDAYCIYRGPGLVLHEANDHFWDLAGGFDQSRMRFKDMLMHNLERASYADHVRYVVDPDAYVQQVIANAAAHREPTFTRRYADGRRYYCICVKDNNGDLLQYRALMNNDIDQATDRINDVFYRLTEHIGGQWSDPWSQIDDCDREALTKSLDAMPVSAALLDQYGRVLVSNRRMLVGTDTDRLFVRDGRLRIVGPRLLSDVYRFVHASGEVGSAMRRFTVAPNLSMPEKHVVYAVGRFGSLYAQENVVCVFALRTLDGLNSRQIRYILGMDADALGYVHGALNWNVADEQMPAVPQVLREKFNTDTVAKVRRRFEPLRSLLSS